MVLFWIGYRRFDAGNSRATVAHPIGRWAKDFRGFSTLMNKGLELIKATHLFGVSENIIDVVIHPESIIHSLVEFIDGSMLAQLASQICNTYRACVGFSRAS